MSNRNKANRAAPAPALQETGAAPEATPSEVGNVASLPVASPASERAKRLEAKMTGLQTAKQLFAQAADIAAEGKSKQSEATEAASRGASVLYDGQLAGLFSPAEVKAATGDVWGYVPKKDGSPGATVAGEGGALLKRLNRCIAAYEYAAGLNDGGKFFAGLPTDEIAPILAEVDNGLSVFSAYKKFDDVKKAHTAKRQAAFSIKAIEAITAALLSSEAIEKFTGNGPLMAAYRELIDAHGFLIEALPASE